MSVSGFLEADPTLAHEWDVAKSAKRVVIKIGSNLLTVGGSTINKPWIAARALEIVRLMREGRSVIIVTSGSIAAGVSRLRLNRPPSSIAEKQAAAAAGQSVILGCYEEAFSAHGVYVGQVLLTRDDVENRHRYLNARATLETLLKFGLVPVVNENDTVVVEEIKFGDNDTLSANVADLISADLLILLSDVEGLYETDPRINPEAKPIGMVRYVTPEIEKFAGGSGSAVGRGGMITKLKAAKMAGRSGCRMVLTSGFRENPIASVFGPAPVGTLFLAAETPLSAHKKWIANSRMEKGDLILDPGAVVALRQGGSLLAKGIVAVTGEFDRGDAVFCVDGEGKQIAKGGVNYHSDDIRRIAGMHSRDFESVLGFLGDKEVIHRDHMVMMEGTALQA